MAALGQIRHFVWALTAAVDRVAVCGSRRAGDGFALCGSALWLFAVSAAPSPVTAVLLLAFGPYLASVYLADRRLAAEVARSRTGLESVRDLRVELSLGISEKVIALEAAVLPIGLLLPAGAAAIAAVILVKVASIAVHADLPPNRSVWSAARERLEGLSVHPAPVPSI